MCTGNVQAGIGKALVQLVISIGANDRSVAAELSPAGGLSLLQVHSIAHTTLSDCSPWTHHTKGSQTYPQHML